MIKPASSNCNMRCRYCFYHSLAENRSEFSFGMMQEKTARALIDQALDFAAGDSIYFAFQGGEPTLIGLEFYRFFVAYVQKRNLRHSIIYYSLQTNGTTLDEEWAEFFRDNGFLIGLSLDGDQNANRYRVDADRKYTFPRVMQAVKLLQDYEVDFNILTVVTGYTADHIEEIYRFFTSNGLRYLQFIPCLRPFGDTQESDLYMTREQYTQFLIRLFQLYVKDYMAGRYTSIRLFDNWVRLFLGQPCEQCGVNGHCSHQFVVEAGGNVYPCDFYCLDEWLLGNVHETTLREMAHSKRAEAFIRESLTIPEACRTCGFYRVCRAGGCKRNRVNRDDCASYRAFFGSCLPLFRAFICEKPPKAH